jgi:hypothetical protein
LSPPAGRWDHARDVWRAGHRARGRGSEQEVSDSCPDPLDPRWYRVACFGSCLGPVCLALLESSATLFSTGTLEHLYWREQT